MRLTTKKHRSDLWCGMWEIRIDWASVRSCSRNLWVLTNAQPESDWIKSVHCLHLQTKTSIWTWYLMWELRNTNTSASILIVCNLKAFSDVWQLLCRLQWESIQPVLCAWECKHLGETATNRSSLCWWKAIVRICHSYPATLSISLVSWLQTSKSQASLGSGTVRSEGSGRLPCTAVQIIPSQMEVAPLHCTVDITQKRRLFKNTKEIEEM